MKNNLMMMNILELDKAQKRLTALQEAWDVLYKMEPKAHLPGSYQVVMNDLQDEINDTEKLIEANEKENGE